MALKPTTRALLALRESRKTAPGDRRSLADHLRLIRKTATLKPKKGVKLRRFTPISKQHVVNHQAPLKAAIRAKLSRQKQLITKPKQRAKVTQLYRGLKQSTRFTLLQAHTFKKAAFGGKRSTARTDLAHDLKKLRLAPGGHGEARQHRSNVAAALSAYIRKHSGKPTPL